MKKIHSISFPMKTELQYVCSRAFPTDEQIERTTKIVLEQSKCLENMFDNDGFSTLILMCRNNLS